METAREKHREKYEWRKEEEHSEIQQASLALPSGKEGEQLMIEQRPAMVETWTYKNKNALMYVPEGTEHSVIEQIEKKAKGTQEVIHEHTRFSRNPFPDASCSGMLAGASAAKLAQQQGKIGVNGQVFAPSETPKVNGFEFVATPSPAPVSFAAARGRSHSKTLPAMIGSSQGQDLPGEGLHRK
ncbi:splicing factor ESS-2 homolog [Nematostella vectensis]|uniref:splicing factor ESS-2 homolog n=1 Tax=Nematostella vectensis TaxID=45351 RepID=UPI002076EE70|nr:splicing factor ESS-2 homolog [Nematostella vectensis]